jgi:hypothetical protein
MSPATTIVYRLCTVVIVGPALPAYTPNPLHCVPGPIVETSDLGSLSLSTLAFVDQENIVIG